jgi:DNA-binding beta-propeller fold protein YncE
MSHRRALLMIVLVAATLVGLEAWPASAGQVGDLSFEGCASTSAAVGCVNLPAGAPGSTFDYGVAVSPDGHSVYVTATDRVEHFFVGANGALVYDGCVSDDGSGGECADVPGTATPLFDVGAVAVAPSGAVYVVSAHGVITHFFAAAQGQLTYDGCVSDDGNGGACADIPGSGAPLAGAVAVAVSSTGAIYVAGSSANAVSHFFAAPGGQISWDGCVSDDASQGCVDVPGDPLGNPVGLAVSPDGKSVYVASFDSHAVSHLFAAPGGQISWDGCVSDDGSGGTCADVPGTGRPLDGATGVAVSADGTSVYVASQSAGAISHLFAAPQGQITWDGCVSNDGSGGSCADAPGTPLGGAAAVATSPDRDSVYVASDQSNSLTTFAAAPQGQITFQGCIAHATTDGCTAVGADAFQGTDDVALSPDGSSVYLTSSTLATVAHFVRTGASPPTVGGTGTTGTPGTGGGTPTGGNSGNGATRAVASKLSMTPSAFTPRHSGPPLLATGKQGTVHFQLNVPATMTFTVKRAVKGRRVGKRGKTSCVVQTSSNRHKPGCTRLVSVAGSFTRAGVAGANSFDLTGRFNGHTLPAGSYRLIATPSGKGTTAVSVAFTIKR